MTKTNWVYLTGKCKWCRHTTPDPWGNWKITLYPNDDSLNLLKELQAEGLKNAIKHDDDGDNVTFRRPVQKMMRGKVVGFAPPEVLHKDGLTPIRDTLIGNGSDVTLKLCVYPYTNPQKQKGIAARWESMRVDNLIPFDSKRDFAEDQAKQVRGLAEQPVHEVTF